ncbi:MAG: hypothetical protein ACYTGV_05140, partial [Planctomycetota bacterium]
MSTLGIRAPIAGALALLLVAGCSGESTPPVIEVAQIFFETPDADPGGAGQLYDMVLVVGSAGGAPKPDQFELVGGRLPAGVELLVDREDTDGDGLPDPGGAPTGNARLLGFPRETGSFDFTVRAVASPAGQSAALAADGGFTLNIGAGSVAILTPQTVTVDPRVPAFPEVLEFVNPSNPQAFFSFSFEIAGGSTDNLLRVYLPRELELSTFDQAVVDKIHPVGFDTIENAADPVETNSGDGGWFVLQPSGERLQIGGYQSPRGKVGTIDRHEGGLGIDPRWFQRPPTAGGPALDSRRTLGDTSMRGGDPTLGTVDPIRFSDYFDPDFEGTHASFNPGAGQERRKYPFTSDEYRNAFFLDFQEGVDITPLRFRIIVEAIDTAGTDSRDDDTIDRASYVVQVKIPDIRIDTAQLLSGQAGVDYTDRLVANGGVPPLGYELSFVDSTLDLQANDPDNLSKQLFGLEMDSGGQFFGVPRASGTAELTVRVFADVMNPITQGSDSFDETRLNPGEYNGTHPLSGQKGLHRTFAVDFTPPTIPVITNLSLAAGTDGEIYPEDTLRGAGGVPRLVPDPVGFEGDYDSSSVSRNYEYGASYRLDSSYPGQEGQIDPDNELPRALVLDGDADSPTNGRISGLATDRGFHGVEFTQRDFYLGPTTAPNLDTNRQNGNASLALSISPDTAIYMRGAAASAGGTPSGLLDESAQMGEALMVPMFLEAGFFRAVTSEEPQPLSTTEVPVTVDILPVMLANGGSDAHVDKSIPSVSGVWPAESSHLNRWAYYFRGAVETAWKHLQQETTWIQTPTPEQARIYLWAETKIKKFNSAASTGGDSKRYQQYDPSGKRGVMIQNPLTGDYWFPAILSNAKDDADGSQFGAEFVLGTAGTSPTSSTYGSVYSTAHRYYSYPLYGNRGDREVQLQGLGSYLETLEASSRGRIVQGRTGVSVAVSADGVWGATALPGGTTQKILLWRTDKQPIPDPILGQGHVQALNGRDAEGGELSNSACIVSLGDQDASGKTITSDQRHLLPDSLMFVRDGLIFLMETHLDYVFGISLVDGHLSSKWVNDRESLSTAQGTGPSAGAARGQYIPDADIVRGLRQQPDSSVQFSFTGNAPSPGEEGPDKVAFVAGDNARLISFDDNPGTYTSLSSEQARRGYAQAGNRNKSLLFLETSTGVQGLDLDDSTLKDLTGTSNLVYGDLLTPGRPGEELDFLAVSPDGKYVAVVRDQRVSGGLTSTTFTREPSFGTITTSSTSSWYQASDDILIFATTNEDLDSADGTQTVLYLGSGNISANFSGTPAANGVAYVAARAHLNSKARRINGVTFSADSETVFFKYAGDNTYWTKYYGSTDQLMINSNPAQSTTWRGLSSQVSLRVHLKDPTTGGKIDITKPSSFMKN